jgi:hypothetical protein
MNIPVAVAVILEKIHNVKKTNAWEHHSNWIPISRYFKVISEEHCAVHTKEDLYIYW